MAQNIPFKTVTVEVPAKVILFGEHSVVEPNNHAILFPVYDLTCKATVFERTDQTCVISDVLQGSVYTTKLASLQDVLSTVASDYSLFVERGDDSLSAYQEPSNFLRACVAVAYDYVESLTEPVGLDIEYASTIPVGGFGSSAAVAACIIKAIVTAHGLALTSTDWYDLTLHIEKLAHGYPSGADVAVVTAGSPIIVTKNKDKSITVRPLKLPVDAQKILQDVRIYFTGPAEQSTAEMVSAVSQNPNKTALFKELEDTTMQAIGLIENDTLTAPRLAKLLNASGQVLESLPAVHADVSATFNSLRNEGVAIKISGAGSLTSPACGVILVLGSTDKLRGPFYSLMIKENS